MSDILDCIPVGEEIEIRGPAGEIAYRGNGKFILEGKGEDVLLSLPNARRVWHHARLCTHPAHPWREGRYDAAEGC